MTEEERRRCIIIGACPPDTSQTQALAEELYVAERGPVAEGSWGRLIGSQQERYLAQAAHVLAYFAISDRRAGGGCGSCA